ncbi:MAG: DUF4290 domain-containing protein [Flavobacteriales bacterium]|nr:DUF4290 domain-containing protein [Flavobacteriales bacterium]
MPLNKISMNYNTSRTRMIIPVYGRHIQQLVDHAIKLEDKEEKDKMVLAIVDVMGQLNPHLRDVPDFTHKLWDHIHIMSNFQLDVKSPYPKPAPEQFMEKPNKMTYPGDKIRFKHYGKGTERLIEEALKMEEGEEKQALIESIANLMKKHYLTWGRSSVDDAQILSDIKRISRGNLEVKGDIELIATKDISPRNTALSSSTNNKNRKKGKRKNFKQKKKY